MPKKASPANATSPVARKSTQPRSRTVYPRPRGGPRLTKEHVDPPTSDEAVAGLALTIVDPQKRQAYLKAMSDSWTTAPDGVFIKIGRQMYKFIGFVAEKIWTKVRDMIGMINLNAEPDKVIEVYA